MSLVACGTAKKGSGDKTTGILGIPNPLHVAEPVSVKTLASLRAIADDPRSMLPATELADPADPADPDPSVEPEGGCALLSDRKPAKSTTEAWRSAGLDPDEVNPGDIFSENEGPILRKAFSLIDGADATSRVALLNRIAETEVARVPLTFTHSEIAALRLKHPSLDLPTRSVALDFRTETHTIDLARFHTSLASLAQGDTAGVIESPERLSTLKRQLDSVKKRLASGETLRLVTAVTESTSIHASYPGAPVGRRDAERLANTVSSFFPHIPDLKGERDLDGYRLTRHPRVVWEFDSRELKLEGDEIRIVGENENRG